MERKRVALGEVVEYKGKKYRAEPEVEKGTCTGCDLYDDGDRLCGDRSRVCPYCGYLIFKEVKEETPRRHIELGVVKVEGGRVTFKIIEQTHWGEEFTQRGSLGIFEASNGIRLSSIVFPEWKDDNHLLYCRGCNCEKDDKELNCTAVDFAKISEAISEYNSTNGKGYEKPWPQIGNAYYFVTDQGVIFEFTYTEDAGDVKRRELGNFFRTRGEAVAAAK